MADASTATVRTLTAEIRTLTVGNRQVTMSVAKQLDIVPLMELEIMGRIRFCRAEEEGLFDRLVVGCHNGKLSIARWQPVDEGFHLKNPAFEAKCKEAQNAELIVLAGLR